jgi:hypothetical protein
MKNSLIIGVPRSKWNVNAGFLTTTQNFSLLRTLTKREEQLESQENSETSHHFVCTWRQIRIQRSDIVLNIGCQDKQSYQKLKPDSYFILTSLTHPKLQKPRWFYLQKIWLFVLRSLQLTTRETTGLLACGK